MINVAIIDDGVADDFIHSPIKHYIVKNNSVEVSHSASDIESHGSKCAYIIERKNTNILLHDIKILNSSQKGSVSDLLVALEWCLRNKMAIINLSIGATAYEHYYAFSSICEQLKREGCIIIAAFNNNGEFTLPAALPSVIGVKQFYLSTFNKELFVDTYAFGQRLLKIGNKFIYCEPCNSFACATVTAAYISNLNNKRKLFGVLYMQRMMYYWFDNLTKITLYNADCTDDFSEIKSYDIQSIYETIVVQKADQRNLGRYLISNRKSIDNVIYCGNMPPLIKIICFLCRIKYWDEAIYHQRTAKKLSSSSQYPPIVYVCGKDIFVKKVAINLRNNFFQKGFSCICFSLNPASYLQGFIYMPCTKKNYELVNSIFHPSVFVSTDLCRENLNPDVTVKIESGSNFWLIFDDHEEVFDSIDNLCEKIIAVLSDN